MNGTQTATRIIAGVLPAMALFATPALAQELQTQTTPPPIPTQAAPAPSAPAPAPVAQTAPAPTAVAPSAQAAYQASLDAATGRTASADAPAAREPAARSQARATTSRTVTRTPPVRPAAAAPAAPAAPVAATPAPAAPVAAEPAPALVAAAPVAAPEATSETTATQATTTTSGTPVWAWFAGGLAALAAIALGIFALRRRREEEVEWEEAYVEPQYKAEAAPLAAAPLAHDESVVEHAELVTPPSDDVAAITEAAAPVAGRPWIELSLRPVRAGATEESALVDLELILANAGELDASNVRVSTFMLGDAAVAPTDMDRLLATGHAGTEVDAGSIGAGEGSRIDARLAIPRHEMDDASTFQPVVVADVRYTLPGGGEGRTAAAFTVGVHDETDTPTPLRLGGDMREDVAATLHGVPERV